MAQYIDKDAVVAEIEKLKGKISDGSSYYNGWQHALRMLEIEMNAIEVKEVDLEKEYEEFVVDDPILGNFITNDTMGMELAKHFFELGLKVQKEKRYESNSYNR